MYRFVRPNQESITNIINSNATNRFDMTVSPEQFTTELSSSPVTMPPQPEKLRYKVKGEELKFNDSALGQFLQKVKIPVNFYRRCPDWLKLENITHFNSKHKRNYLFRMSGPSQVRAALSDSYGIIDDKDLFPILFESLADRDDIAYRFLHYDDHITQVAIDFTDARSRHNDQEYVAGLLLTNSETGHSSVWIEPIVHIPTCSFVSRHTLKRQGVDCRIIHRGHFPKEKVKPLVDQAKEISQVGIIQLAEAFQSTVSRDHALRMAENIEALPNRFVEILEEEWQHDERIIKAEAARRIILMAEELPLFQRIQVEQKAGSFIGLFDNYKSRFSEILGEIND